MHHLYAALNKPSAGLQRTPLRPLTSLWANPLASFIVQSKRNQWSLLRPPSWSCRNSSLENQWLSSWKLKPKVRPKPNQNHLLLNKILCRWVPAAKGLQGPPGKLFILLSGLTCLSDFLCPLFISPPPEIQPLLCSLCRNLPSQACKKTQALSNVVVGTEHLKLPPTTLVQRLHRSAISGSVAAAVRGSCRNSHRRNIEEKPIVRHNPHFYIYTQQSLCYTYHEHLSLTVSKVVLEKPLLDGPFTCQHLVSDQHSKQNPLKRDRWKTRTSSVQ